jgi:pimeloyl-ACP methyl ester carboxylesterase
VLWLQRKMMFFPETLAADARLEFARPHEERWIDSPTGNRLHAVAFRADRARGTLLYFHGNAGSVRSWGELGPDLVEHGYDVVIADYAGYGKSRGRIHGERTLLDDAVAIYDAVAPAAAQPIVPFGRSLGTGIATFLATVRACDRLLLETPYASILDVARRALPWLPSILVRIRLDTLAWIPDVRRAVHVFHGDRDEVIPLASAERLRPVLPPGSSFAVIEGGTHNDLARFPAYQRALRRALT